MNIIKITPFFVHYYFQIKYKIVLTNDLIINMQTDQKKDSSLKEMIKHKGHKNEFGEEEENDQLNK